MENVVNVKPDFYRGKRVFITGNTGFKGLWLTEILALFGADITGYSLPSTPEGSRLFDELKMKDKINAVTGDVRDFDALSKAMKEAKPEIVFHLAAQPLVIESYRDPIGTYMTNVVGTLNLLESVRQGNTVKSFVNVTTDKVYKNMEWVWGYREDEPLDGFDPYSNSKSCSELVTHSYDNSFLREMGIAVSTARAGNVIGGGDFSANRIIPDCIRAACDHSVIVVRNPSSTRPYQHVLEPLFAYLMIAQGQYEDLCRSGWYNVGPDDCDCVTTGELANIFCKLWGEGQTWKSVPTEGPHEANFLKLDSAKIKSVFGWKPHWHIEDAVEQTILWAKAWERKENISVVMEEQIYKFVNEGELE